MWTVIWTLGETGHSWCWVDTKVKLFSSWWPGSREREEGRREPNISFKDDLTSFHKKPPSEGSRPSFPMVPQVAN